MAVDNVSALPMTMDKGERMESFDLVNATVIIVIAVVVNVTNLLTLLVVRSYKYVFNPNILIGGIALVHYVSTLSICPLIAYTYFAAEPLPPLICDLFDAMWTFYQLLSTSIITLMVLDRYMAIRKPILYRTRLTGAFMKYVMVCALLTSLPLSFTPIVVKVFEDDTKAELAREVSRGKYCIGLHNQHYRVHTILILSINSIHLLVGLFCYISFLIGVRNFVNRWLARFSNQNSSTVDPPDVETSSCWCRCVKEQPQKSLSKEELVERTLHLMKSLHVKRCTRISKTIAVAAGLYSIPWLFSQVSIFYELVTGEYLPILDYIIIRLVLAVSVLNPLVYVTFSKTYRYGYHRVLAKPIRSCGFEWRSRQPLGLSGSEMQRISHRMALEEWESPGLVRRQYSKRRIKRRINRMHHVYTVSEDSAVERSHDRQKQSRYRKNTSIDSSTGTSSATASMKIARFQRNSGQQNGVHAKFPVANCDQRMDTNTSFSGLPKDGNGSALCCEKSLARDSYRQEISEERQSASCEVYSLECTHMSSDGKRQDDPHLHSQDSLLGPKTYLPKTLRTLAASAVESARCPKKKKHQRSMAESSPERVGGGGVSIFGASKASVLKPFEILAKTDPEGHVCIHLEVIEFVGRHEMVHKNGSLVSTVRKCQLKGKSPKTTEDGQSVPSFVFSLRENRFLPEGIHQECTDTYSCQYGEDTISDSFPAPLHTITMPNSNSATSPISGDIPNLAVSEAKHDCSPDSSRTTSERQKRTSEILRESSRYSDDIVMLNDLILQGQLQDTH